MAQTLNEELEPTPEEALELAHFYFEQFFRFPSPVQMPLVVKLDASVAAVFDENTPLHTLLSKEAFQVYHECGYLRRLSDPTQLGAAILWSWFNNIAGVGENVEFMGDRGGKCIIEVLQYLIDLGFPISPKWLNGNSFLLMRSVALCKYLVSIGFSLTDCEWKWTTVMDHVQISSLWRPDGGSVREFVTQMIPVFLENGFVPTPQNTPIGNYGIDVVRIEFMHRTFGFPVPPLAKKCIVYIPQDAHYYDFFEHAYGIRLSPEDGDVFSNLGGFVSKFYCIHL